MLGDGDVKDRRIRNYVITGNGMEALEGALSLVHKETGDKTPKTIAELC
jgi:hypothetical protein